MHDQRVFNVLELQDFCIQLSFRSRDIHLIDDAYKILKTLFISYKDNNN